MCKIKALVLVFVSLCADSVKSDFELHIIHNNDLHSRIEEISRGGGVCLPERECYGGFARMKWASDRIKSDFKNVIYLNAGDTYQGTPYYTEYKWRAMAKFIDMLKIDVMSLGNHEFDDGLDGLVPYLQSVKTPSVAANMDWHSEPGLVSSNLHRSVTLTVGNVRIDVIGYLTPDTEFLATPGNTGKIVFENEVKALTREAKAARDNGAQIIIALGHSGWPVDVDIARQVPEVDVVIGGHTNTFLYSELLIGKQLKPRKVSRWLLYQYHRHLNTL